MKKRAVSLGLSLVLAFLPLIFLFVHPLFSQTGTAVSPPPAAKIHPDLLAQMQANPDGRIRFIIDMAQTADLSAATERTGVVNQLQQTAAASQTAVRQTLDTLQAAGEIDRYRPFWIVNKIAATGSAAAIRALAARPGVAQIRPDAQVASLKPPEDDPYLSLLQATAVTTGPAQSWGIERIGAPAVWNGLGVDGSGVTIAIMDSGVDWQHPDLIGSYRGNLGGGVFDHTGNWYYPAMPTVTVPFDALGHGTHVAGTAAGQNGIGVAPGAQWIAVGIADQFGFIYESDVHAGFEWLMAPAGDPALAPDIINNSWSGPGQVVAFAEDIAALHAAGIIPVFAAGNGGPLEATIGSPASYTGTLAVGASDDADTLAWFSSRGPSPLTDEIKPWIVAPGTTILSSLPDGRYGYLNGTSMATPHVVGAIALLLSANPALTRPQIDDILAQTAVPITATHPNMESGWGRLDVYAAVASQVNPATLSGVVRGAGQPLPDVTVTITTPSGAELQFVTDENGRYQAWLQPGSYALAAQPFGYAAWSAGGINLTAGQTTTQDIDLTRLPGGAVSGIVRDAATQEPLANVTMTVNGAPAQTTTDGNGRYTLILPAGAYKVRAAAPEHKLDQANVLITPDTAVTQDFSLESAPGILLVDSGQWYYQSQAGYYAASLTALSYPFDTWTIRHPLNDVPAAADLLPYDAVIWSSPLDSPGYLGASSVISDYLGAGGSLLVSGQNVAYYDGLANPQYWWYTFLEASFRGGAYVTQTIAGAADTSYAGIWLTLNGPDSAQNQRITDITAPLPESLTRPAFYYEDGQAAGLQAGDCRPFRLSYLGFGLEGVSDGADRAAILDRSLAYFAAPRRQFGARFSPENVDDFALPGQRLVYTVTLRNLSETLTDTFTIGSVNSGWNSSVTTRTLTLGPCQTGETVVTIDAPANAAKDDRHTTRVTAVSQTNPAVSADLVLRHKIPGRILFVDDDRFYNEEPRLLAALDGMGLSYDVWETGWNRSGRGSPPADFLAAYDIIIWYTGYDWFAPVTPAENEGLTQFLAQGGRLFLTSQDFLYYNYETPLARKYLGILDYRESFTPTVVLGGNNPAVSPQLAGPNPLDFGVYQNHGDGVIPAPGSRPFLWSGQDIPLGAATADGWRAVFLGVPLETLDDGALPVAMNDAVGWIGDLGDSTFAVDRRVGPAGQARTYTITLRNAAAAPANQVWLTNTLPAGLDFVPNSLTGGAVYDAAARQITWQGSLNSGAARLFTYRAVPDGALPSGAAVTNTLTIRYARHGMRFTRAAVTWVDAPDLSRSELTAVTNQPFAANVVTYTLRLQNDGLAAAGNISTVVNLPYAMVPMTGTLASSSGAPFLAGQRIHWQGDLPPGGVVTITLALEREPAAVFERAPATAVIRDGVTATVLRENWLDLPPWRQYLPVVLEMVAGGW